jgi:hypothetical protein
MGITGPGWAGNYQQSNTANPTCNANVATYPVGANVLNLTWPIATYVQPNPPLSEAVGGYIPTVE